MQAPDAELAAGVRHYDALSVVGGNCNFRAAISSLDDPRHLINFSEVS